MKQIERKGSAQRAICELLDQHPDLTINDLSEMRRVHFRAIARQVKALMQEGFVCGGGYPRRWRRTSKPVPPVVENRFPSHKRRGCGRLQRVDEVPQTFDIPEIGELERVISSWVGA